MQIRSYTPEDTYQIIELFYNTVHEVNIKDYTEAQVNAWAPKATDNQQWQNSLEHWENSLSRKITYIAEQEGRILGFAELEDNGHIDRFYCHKDFQGQGIGACLYNTIESKARSLKLNRLFVEASITAKPFFERQGFKAIAKQEVSLRGATLANFRMHKHL